MPILLIVIDHLLKRNKLPKLHIHFTCQPKHITNWEESKTGKVKIVSWTSALQYFITLRLSDLAQSNQVTGKSPYASINHSVFAVVLAGVNRCALFTPANPETIQSMSA